AAGRLKPELRAMAPRGARRMSANPCANGGLLRRDLRLPDFRHYAVDVPAPARERAGNTRPLGAFLRDVTARNPDNFRVFSPDENTSNKLDAIYEASRKLWLADYLPADADGGELAPDGRVMEMLSEHTLEGWRSEEHTSELQSRENLVCRLLLEKKKHKRRRDEYV